jgi:SAM-dependent methyltransferase/uncharacterized protein YbaR (Trm112 family)
VSSLDLRYAHYVYHAARAKLFFRPAARAPHIAGMKTLAMCRRIEADTLTELSGAEMIARWSDRLLSIVVCPRCRSRLVSRAAENRSGEGECVELECSNPACDLADEGFPVLNGQPVLIDFNASIIDRAGIVGRNGGSVQNRDVDGNGIKTHVHRLLFGDNKTARYVAAEFASELKQRKMRPRVLIIGGGTIGVGSSALCDDGDVEIVSVDIYASKNTTFVADGHRLPLADGCIDAVWIQAVLEHVLDPPGVVAEIHRVLKPEGVVFADTPFMQQVHEGIYDFTRFTLHGHRWLFRRFTVIDAGVTRGAGTSLVWCIRYFIRALTGNNGMGTLLSLPFFWLRYMDGILNRRMSADAASGVYFLGRRSNTSISPKDMVGFYDELERLRDARRRAHDRAADAKGESKSAARRQPHAGRRAGGVPQGEWNETRSIRSAILTVGESLGRLGRRARRRNY